ncbi:MAG: RNA polymerase sigma factor [Phycisphaerae bacterium]|nr:RNA polymerase sigma factor [Phycisphaerae bacterium]
MPRTPQQIHDELLVLRCQSGHAEALSELLHRWHARLAHRARLLMGGGASGGGGEEAVTADALQETLIAIARSIHQLDDPALFGPWARRILAHKCADAVRRQQQQRRLSREVVNRSEQRAERADPVQDDLAPVRLALDQLPVESRALLVMRYARDMSTQAIAAALQVAEGTVKSRLHQARNELKSILERNT